MSAPTFTAPERRTLAVLPRVCSDIRSCRLVRDWNKQDHATRMWKQPDGTWLIQTPDYDADDVRSFLTIARKLVANDEPTSIFKILNLIGRYGTDDDRKQVKQAKANLSWDDKPGALRFFVIEPKTGKEIEYSAPQLVNIVCNAEVFHSAEDLEADWLRIRPHRDNYIGMVLQRLLYMCEVALWAERVARSSAWIQDGRPCLSGRIA